MVPPPGGTGDEFPDFDKMTFEEQMAWLESLAKRQGAKSEEFTTAANVDVPVPKDAKVDEPGYVPFEGSRSAREAKEGRLVAADETPSAPALAAPEPEEAPLAEEWAASELIEPVEEEAGDAMRWLDSISAQPGEGEAEADLFDASATPEASPEWGELESLFSDLESPAASEPELELDFLAAVEPELDLFAEEVPAELAAEAEPPAEEDFLGGADPMRWLESLAARQGVSSEQLTTSADLEIEEISPDTVIDEPGYVPFEGSRSAREAAAEAVPSEEEPAPAFEALSEEAEEAALFDLDWEAAEPIELEALLTPAAEEAAPLEDELAAAFEASSEEAEEAALFDLDWEAAEPIELEALQAQAAGDVDELLGGADPMAWLETLAKRQGASLEELTTSADLEIAELPEDTVIDEPGYEPYSALEILPPSRAEAARGEPVEELPAEMEAAGLDEALSWLEDLVAEPESLSEYLAVEEEQPAPPAEPAVAEAASRDDPLAGMTDEDIAYAQAHHQLSGEQELAWLKRQAAKLAEVRQSQELEMQLEGEEELPPAELAEELPPWLQQMRLEEGAEVSAEDSDLLMEAPDVSDWLEEVPSEGEEPTLWESVSTSADDLSLGTVESLWPEAAEEEGLPEEGLIPESELAAFLKGDLVPDEPDLLAEALDAEYERKLVGDEAEPEWYTDAVKQAAAEAPPIPDAESLSAPAEASVESVPAEAQPDQMPGWLVGEAEEAPALEISESEMPGWLRESPAAAEPVATGDMPGWLQDEVPAAEPSEDMPDWLQEFRPTDEEQAAEWLAEPAEQVEPAPPPVAPLPPRPAPVAVVELELPPAPRPAAVPPGELFEEYRRRLEENPSDHPNRLALARALRGSRDLASSLDQYETLIDSSQLLQDVSGDLVGMVQQTPDVPRTRRLLGDAFMRRGMLQEALDAYRSALDQL